LIPLLLVGLTGGIGSGKSTVARMLEERGAVVFDADEFARRAVDPGTPGYFQVVEAFGPEVLGEEGGVDREALAAHVFRDPQARRRLEAIIHPEVARLFQESIAPYRDTDRVVVYSVPLLVEAGLRSAFDIVVVVAAGEEGRVARLAADRGMSEASVRARIGAQASDEERLAVADHVIQNDGTIGELERRVDGLWALLSERAGQG
jgi:dephospho-CoA kinase